MRDKEILLTIPEAAARLGLKEGTLRVWMRDRRVGRVVIGTRSVRIAESEVERLIRDGTVRAESDEGAV